MTGPVICSLRAAQVALRCFGVSVCVYAATELANDFLSWIEWLARLDAFVGDAEGGEDPSWRRIHGELLSIDLLTLFLGGLLARCPPLVVNFLLPRDAMSTRAQSSRDHFGQSHSEELVEKPARPPSAHPES